MYRIDQEEISTLLGSNRRKVSKVIRVPKGPRVLPRNRIELCCKPPRPLGQSGQSRGRHGERGGKNALF